MIENIQEHFNDEDIIKLNITSEIKKWEEELHFNSKEMEFYQNLLNSSLVEKLNTNPEDSKFLFSQLKTIQECNEFQIKTLLKFQKKLEGMKECDDVQCENYYVQDHLVLKSALEKHFSDYRTVKNYVYKYLNSGLAKML